MTKNELMDFICNCIDNNIENAPSVNGLNYVLLTNGELHIDIDNQYFVVVAKKKS